MKTLLVVLMIALVVGPTTALAYSVEDACGFAERTGWHSGPASTSCLYAIMADIAGPGPDIFW